MIVIWKFKNAEIWGYFSLTNKKSAFMIITNSINAILYLNKDMETFP